MRSAHHARPEERWWGKEMGEGWLTALAASAMDVLAHMLRCCERVRGLHDLLTTKVGNHVVVKLDEGNKCTK